MALYNMKEILADAQARGYGVGFFNTINMEMIHACIAAAEELDSPIIIGTAESLLPIAPFEWIAPAMLEAARRARTVERCVLRAGFGIHHVRRFRARAMKTTSSTRRRSPASPTPWAWGWNGELGSVSGLTDETGHEDEMVYTDPAEAADFLARTGAAFLAVSIGTQHGVYKAEPHLDIPRLRGDTRRGGRAAGAARPVPGFRTTISATPSPAASSRSTSYTDIILAGKRALAEHPEASYPDSICHAREAMKEATLQKLAPLRQRRQGVGRILSGRSRAVRFLRHGSASTSPNSLSPIATLAAS